MFYALLVAGFAALALVAVFVWTAVRSAVRQLIENTARQAREDKILAFWTSVPEDVPLPVHLTEVDPSHTPAGYAPDGLGDRGTYRTPGVRPVKLSEVHRRAY